VVLDCISRCLSWCLKLWDLEIEEQLYIYDIELRLLSLSFKLLPPFNLSLCYEFLPGEQFTSDLSLKRIENPSLRSVIKFECT